MRQTNKQHTFSHYFIPIKLSSICFEQSNIHHQEVISVHAANNILPRTYVSWLLTSVQLVDLSYVYVSRYTVQKM